LIQQQNLTLSKETLSNWVLQIADQSENAAIIIDVNDPNLSIMHCNHEFTRAFGYEREHLIGKNIQLFNGKKTNVRSIEILNEQLLYKRSFQSKLVHYKYDGTAFWNEITCHPLKDSNNDVQFLLLFFADVTMSSLSRMISKLEREVYEHFEKDNELHSICQLITKKIEMHFVRKVYCTIHLLQNDELTLAGHGQLPLRIAQKLSYAIEKNYKQYDEDQVYTEKVDENTYTYKQFLDEDIELQFKTKWIKPMYSLSNRLKGFIIFYLEQPTAINQLDINFLDRISPVVLLANKFGEQKKDLKYLAYYDTSVNIPNAHFFRNKVTEWINEGKQGMILIIHSTEYSKIVDLYGRQTGDELLRQMVERLNLHNKNHEEFIARFSNSLIIATCINPDEIQHYDMRIRPLTLIPYFLNEKETYITLKIGVGYFNQDTSVDNSIRQADLALSKARQNSGTSISFFEAEIDEKLQLEMDTLNQLTYGIKHDEISINLQPKVNIKTGRIDGFEALSRWHSAKLGNVSPSIFIPLAEQAGHIRDIDSMVLKKVLNWLKSRYDSDKKIVPVAVNISPDHFYDEKFLPTFKEILNDYDIPRNYIKLELTESIELVDFNRAKSILTELKNLGVDCSIDDFGVGYSSLSYLPKLPFSEIKIDRSFVSAINDPGMYAVVQTIIQLATNLQMRAVAEGIETLEQFIMLKNMGCHIGQGYFLHKPMTIDVANVLLDSI
jgi:PAS domain S-box-containing protein